MGAGLRLRLGLSKCVGIVKRTRVEWCTQLVMD